MHTGGGRLNLQSYFLRRSLHHEKTATELSQGGHAFAERPKLMSGRTGASSRARYVSNSLSSVSSCVRMSAWYLSLLLVYMFLLSIITHFARLPAVAEGSTTCCVTQYGLAIL